MTGGSVLPGPAVLRDRRPALLLSRPVPGADR